MLMLQQENDALADFLSRLCQLKLLLEMDEAAASCNCCSNCQQEATKKTRSYCS
jgi:hypothetical protein